MRTNVAYIPLKLAYMGAGGINNAYDRSIVVFLYVHFGASFSSITSRFMKALSKISPHLLVQLGN